MVLKKRLVSSTLDLLSGGYCICRKIARKIEFGSSRSYVFRNNCGTLKMSEKAFTVFRLRHRGASEGGFDSGIDWDSGVFGHQWGFDVAIEGLRHRH